MHARLPAASGGFAGVDVFFVLSGFLITTLLVREMNETGRIDLGRFVARRLARLAPPLGLMLLAYVAIAPFLWPDMASWEHVRDAVVSSLYLSDLSVAFSGAPTILGHTWSLAVEQRFYLVWPLVLAAVFRIGTPRGRLVALVLAFALSTGWRVFCVLDGSHWRMVYYRFDTHVSGLVLGAAVALAATGGARLPPRVADALAFVALAALVASSALWVWGDRGFLLWGQSLAECASAGLVIALSGGRGLAHRLLSLRPIAYLGLISYSLYLWHYPIARLARNVMDPLPTFAVTLTVSLLIAAASWRFAEAPLAARRRVGQGANSTPFHDVNANRIAD